MPSGKNILILDAGTTAIKAIVFDDSEKVLSRSSEALAKAFPKDGWVEQGPKQIIEKARLVIKNAVKESGVAPDTIQGFGITNQRETIVAWHKETGEPFYPAIVWEDMRTRAACDAALHEVEQTVLEKTGLPIDPYFSATKIRWLLDNVSEVKQALNDAVLQVGTIDSWLAWNLLSGKPHVTDETNAARTLLFNIKTRQWGEELLQLFNIPSEILPKVQRSQSLFGRLDAGLIGAPTPLVAICGDQQASMYAAGLGIGTTKVTYGTGTFIMQVIGSEFAIENPFFTTLVASGDQPIYGIEAKIDRGGPQVEPLLSDRVKLEDFLRRLVEDVNVYLKQLPMTPKEVVIDGGVSRDDLLPRIQPAITGIPVRQHHIFDGTALGVARLVRQ